MNKEKTSSEYLIKIIVIGDTSTGKSSLIQRYVFDKFIPNYKATIGVDFVTKTIHLEEDLIIKLQIWDIAGQERFGGMTRVYYKETYGCLLLFDLSSYSTFESVRNWKADLDQKVRMSDGSKIPTVLIANKSDLDRDPRITDADINTLSQEFTAYFTTSTKLNQNINEAADALLKEIVERTGIRKINSRKKRLEEKIDDSIKLEEPEPKTKPKKSKCSTC